MPDPALTSLPTQATARVQKLNSYEISHARKEAAFDQLASLAADFFNVPYARISFITKDEVFVKAQVGETAERILPVSQSIDALILSATDVLHKEALSTASPWSKSIPMGAESYLAVPVRSDEGHILGCVAVMDNGPLHVDTRTTSFLNKIAQMVVEHLENQVAIRKTLQAYDNRLHMLVHDLKNPLTTISLQSELMGRLPGAPERIVEMAGKINRQTRNTIDALNFILSPARDENGSVKMLKIKVELIDILQQVIKDFTAVASRKHQKVNLNYSEDIALFGSPERLYTIFAQLLSNALKFSASCSTVNISVSKDETKVTVGIEDQGQGILAEEMPKLFLKFARLSSQPTEQERSNGLGLILVSMLVDLHKGNIWAESEGANAGATFFVAFPLK